MVNYKCSKINILSILGYVEDIQHTLSLFVRHGNTRLHNDYLIKQKHFAKILKTLMPYIEFTIKKEVITI